MPLIVTFEIFNSFVNSKCTSFFLILFDEFSVATDIIWKRLLFLSLLLDHWNLRDHLNFLLFFRNSHFFNLHLLSHLLVFYLWCVRFHGFGLRSYLFSRHLLVLYLRTLLVTKDEVSKGVFSFSLRVQFFFWTWIGIKCFYLFLYFFTFMDCNHLRHIVECSFPTYFFVHHHQVILRSLLFVQQIEITFTMFCSQFLVIIEVAQNITWCFNQIGLNSIGNLIRYFAILVLDGNPQRFIFLL